MIKKYNADLLSNDFFEPALREQSDSRYENVKNMCKTYIYNAMASMEAVNIDREHRSPKKENRKYANQLIRFLGLIDQKLKG